MVFEILKVLILFFILLFVVRAIDLFLQNKQKPTEEEKVSVRAHKRTITVKGHQRRKSVKGKNSSRSKSAQKKPWWR